MDKIEENIIRDNAGLIWKITEKFYNVDKKDLFQAGALGIVKAYRNYKKDGTTKFSSYAYDYIFGEMYSLASNKELKVSRDIKKLYLLIEKTRYKLAQKLERIPNNHELALFLEIEEEKIEQALLSAGAVMSLDDDNDEERNLHEVVAYQENITADDKILLSDSLKELQPLERDIISARYFEDLTQSETAKKLGITQVMVSRYETKSLSKMRDYMYM